MKKNKIIYIIPYNDTRLNQYFKNTHTPFLCYIHQKISLILGNPKLNKSVLMVFFLKKILKMNLRETLN